MSKSYDKYASCWGVLCPVDVSGLVRWLEAGNARWRPVKGMQPNPAISLPDEALPVIEAVCRYLGPGVDWLRHTAGLSRIVPGVSYVYHRDGQPADWITRVHVPLLTSPDCWFCWEPEGGRKVYMERGWAYSFNTMQPHNYGNDGTTDRVHLLFDAVRG